MDFSTQRTKIIVIGAGLAGLTCAHRLQQQGMEVELYEARTRVGGRVLSAFVGDQVGELGAQNINDGDQAHNLHGLIKEFDLELKSGCFKLTHAYFHQNAFVSIDLLLSEKAFDPLVLKKQLLELASKSTNMKQILDGLFQAHHPLHRALSVRLAAYEGASPDKLSTFYIETLFHMLLGVLSSAHQALGKTEKNVTVLSIKGGNSHLPQKIAKSLGPRLHLNHPLISVKKNHEDSYELQFLEGQKAQVDILILTLPCPGYHRIFFDEACIPKEQVKAIQSIPYGTNAKILVPFPQPSVNHRGLIDDEMGCFFNPDRKLLTLYYIGESSRFSKENLVQTYQKTRKTLQMGFGNELPPYKDPILANDELFTTYHQPLAYSWPNDPYAGGSYSYIAPGQESFLTQVRQEGTEQVKTLFAPIDESLYFAGEHTSILLNVPGTMEAACESGERIARMILSKHA